MQVAGGCRGVKFCRQTTERSDAGADLFGQRHGFNTWRQAKLGGQHAAAGFVGVEGGAAPIRAGKHALHGNDQLGWLVQLYKRMYRDNRTKI